MFPSLTPIQHVSGAWYENQPLEVLDHIIRKGARLKHSISGWGLRKQPQGVCVITARAKELLEDAYRVRFISWPQMVSTPEAVIAI